MYQAFARNFGTNNMPDCSNMCHESSGRGLGDTIGPAGNFASLNDTAKWILSAAMLTGRLEIMAVYVIFTVHFWRA